MCQPSLRLHTVWLVVGWLLVSLVIFLSLSSMPQPTDIKINDKLGHLLAYCTLQFWFAQLYETTRQRLGCFIGLVLLGAGLELLQGLTPHRFMEWADLLANVTGAVIGWLLVLTPLGHSLAWLEKRIIN